MNSFHNVDSKLYYSKESMESVPTSLEKERSSLQFTHGEIRHESTLKKYALKSLKKRRESISTTRNRPMTIVPRLTKSSILQTTHTKEEQQWDPHIDAFDILRAKLNGITRSMQELHVQELFYDEFLKKKKNEFHSKRHSLTDDYKQSIDRGHRRIQSFSYTEEIAKEEAVEEETSWDNPTSSSYLNEEEEKTASVASPNLTALFVTTNNLIHSKLDELSETASIHSESEDASDWRRQFLNLVTLCIQQSEELESLSVDILYAEQRVRELMFLNQSIHEQFHEREKQYEERIRECQEVAKQQLLMIDSLEELMADINMKLESTQKKPEGVKQPEGNEEEEEREQKRREEEEDRRWDFSKAISELLKMEDKLDIVHKMRWDVGMFVGGGVGTGHIIHSFENRLHGIDLMIAGSGMTNEPIDEQEEEEEEQVMSYKLKFAIYL
jgi:hypothetical protein